MSARSHYEVVLLGRSVPAVLCAALLARRGHRVLLLGQGEPGPWIHVSGYRLPRLPSPPLPLGAPHVDGPLEELALGPELLRHVEEPDPPLHVAMPGRRLDLWRDPGDLARELAREFSEVQRPLHDFARLAAETSAALEGVIGSEPQWPPRGWLRRRQASARLARLPVGGAGAGTGPLDEIPEDHPFRAAVAAAAFVVLDAAPWELGPLARALAFGRWRHRARRFSGGTPALLELLERKAAALGAELRLQERAEAIELRRGRVAAVRLTGGGELLGCDHVVSAVPPADLAALLPAAERAGLGPRLAPAGRRLLLVGLLGEAAVPAAVRGELVWVAGPGRPRLPGDLLHVHFAPGPEPGLRVMVAQAWVPERVLASPAERERVRERVLGRLGEVVPFVARHLRLLDSPHDGLPPWRWPSREALPAGAPWSRGPHAAPVVPRAPEAPELLRLPVRTRLPGLLRCDGEVGSGMGLEVGLLVARAAADAVSGTRA